MQITVIEPSVELLTSGDDLQHMLRLIELAGRTCYKSKDKITDNSAQNFVQQILKSGHESVIEHGTATMKFITNRSVTHQLVWHRLPAYSQESQRYCDYGKLGFQVILPVPLEGILKPGTYGRTAADDGWCLVSTNNLAKDLGKYWLDSVAYAYESYLNLLLAGWKSEDARGVLPNDTKTEIIATYNFRIWRHIIKERGLNPHAQEPICRLMLQAGKILASHLPCLFGIWYND